MKRYLATTLLFISLAVPLPVRAQSFVSAETGIVPTKLGSIALGDLNSDGAVDVLVTGVVRVGSELLPVSRIFRNDPAQPGTFTAVEAGLQGTYNSSVDLGDYDNDGDLDLVIIGVVEGSSAVYRNDSDFRFTRLGLILPDVRIASFEPVISAAAAWGDYDNDGDLDILLSGRVISPNATAQPAYLYKNEGGDQFVEVPGIIPEQTGSVEWGDYDNDGDLDILATSQTLQDRPTAIIENHSGTSFELALDELPQIGIGSARWGDFDNDRYLDILLVDRDRPLGVYRNDRSTQRFVSTAVTLPTATYGDWIDFDNDGRRDVLLHREESPGAAGKTSSTSIQFFHQVDGRLDQAASALPGIWVGDIATGDIDRDGLTDITATGDLYEEGNQTGQVFLLYKNTSSEGNQAPGEPSGLDGDFDGDLLILRWDPATDPDNPATSLTYNVRVGTRPGWSDVVSPMSLENGTRLVAEPGNAGHSTEMIIRGLDKSRKYYWSVQAVDASYVGSAFVEAPLGVAGEASPELPARVELRGNYPNPFNPGTTIRYALPERGDVRLAVYNVLGARVSVLAAETQGAGSHEVYWDGRDEQGRAVPSGLYLYRLETAGQTLSRTMLLVK